jgi:hypothetical protein
MREITMYEVLKQLEKELGVKEGMEVFEWYCKTYNVTVGDVAPDTIKYEVFGI